MQHRIQKSDEKHLMNNLKLPQCVQISQVIMAKHENCICRTMNLPHYTDCNMATEMLWSDKNTCHMESICMASDTIDLQIGCHVMRPIYHIILSTNMATDTVCSHSICHKNILSMWQQTQLMCRLVAIQCNWLLKLQ